MIQLHPSFFCIVLYFRKIILHTGVSQRDRLPFGSNIKESLFEGKEVFFFLSHFDMSVIKMEHLKKWLLKEIAKKIHFVIENRITNKSNRNAFDKTPSSHFSFFNYWSNVSFCFCMELNLLGWEDFFIFFACFSATPCTVWPSYGFPPFMERARMLCGKVHSMVVVLAKIHLLPRFLWFPLSQADHFSSSRKEAIKYQ